MITDTDRAALLNPRPCGECGTIHGFHEYAECRKALRARIAELEEAARAYDAVLSEYCDCPERDRLRAVLEKQ